MGKVLLVFRLAVRDLRRHPAQAALLLLAISAATTTLTMGLALRGVTSQPYEQTRAATNGPDVVAYLPLTQRPGHTPRLPAQETFSLAHAPGVASDGGPYPLASASLRIHGVTAYVEAEGRDQTRAQLDQPKLTAGTWVRPDGVVIERTFAEALGAGVGDRLTLNGRSFTVVGIAVTAANPPYPNLCYFSGGGCFVSGPSGSAGLVWVTRTDAFGLFTPANPASAYVMDLKLSDPAAAQAFANRYSSTTPGYHRFGPVFLASWQGIAAADGLLVQDEQHVLMPGAWLLGLLAVASVAVLVGGRMSDYIRRVGLLKAVGGTPGQVTVVLLAENLALALIAAAAGLAAGWLIAPLLTNPGSGLVGTPGAPSLTPSMALEVAGVALAVALAATLIPAIRAARTSTVSALADAARSPRRGSLLVRISRRLPVPLLLGMRLVARRPRRAVLSGASIAVTVMGIVAVLAFHATADETIGGSSRLANPVAIRDEQMLLVVTVMLVTLAALNAIFTAWATMLDARHASALARALGASPGQVSAGLAAAQVLPALPGTLVGVPLGIGLFAVANGGGVVTIPAVPWLVGAVLACLLAVAGLTAIPARAGARRPAGEVLQSEAS